MGEEIVARCDTCGFELYRGETYYQINGEVICEDCLGEFAARLLAPFRIGGEMKKIPWKEIREKYESGRISKDVLAKDYGISTRAIRYHIQKENWVVKPYLPGTAEDCVFSTVRHLARQLERAESGEEVSVGEIKELTSVLKDLVKVKATLEEAEGGGGNVRVEMDEEISAWSK